MMRRYLVVPQALSQMMRDPLGQSPSIDKDQGRAMGLREFGQPIVDILPDGVRRNAAEFVLGNFYPKIHWPAMPHVDHAARLLLGSHEKCGNIDNGLLCCRET